MREIVQKAIDERLNDLKNPKSLLSLNKMESDTNKGYNGRQILEMFQNCEDEGATKVSIFLDTTNCTLQISNDGEKAFSIEGYDSLFYPGLSSKVSSGYIGNKGLGFRSIINWADEIKIISNDFIISFKEENKKDILLNKLNYTEDQLGEIREKRRLKPDVYPIPLLNCGKILDLDEPHLYTTSVIVRYKKDYENDIKTQLDNISVMTLLFLNNITEVEISIDGVVKNIKVEREKNASITKITHSGNEYFVIEDDGLIDENLLQENESIEAKRYSVKIAFSDNLSLKDKVLYNYFKTQIPFELPFVAHASLELDQNRNHSTESEINPFVLDKLFQLHLRLIEILKVQSRKSWLPYLSVDNEKKNLYEAYSKLIDANWNDFEIYPTVVGDYLNSVQAKSLGNDLAKFIDNNNLGSSFKQQILFYDLDINIHQYVSKPDNYVEIIEAIATALDINQRAQLVKLLLRQYPNEKFSVLIDETGILIDKDDYVFTDKTSENKSLKVPSFSKIRFLHSSLFQLLVNELDLQNEANKSRTLKDRLEGISDVHSFEPQTVIKKIISETNEVLKNSSNTYNSVIQEFFQTIFHNYKERSDNPNLENDSRIPCLNAVGKIEDIKNLTLSNEFDGGRLSKKIFGDLYDETYILATIDKLGLQNENIFEVEGFLRWLGINHISIVELKTNNIDTKYIDFVNKEKNVALNKYELFSVKLLDEILSKRNINNVIAWLASDENMIKIFGNFSVNKSHFEKLEYSYYGQKNISDFKNYIYYCISTTFNINNFLITNKREEWFNPFKIDYNYLFGINAKLDKDEVDQILVFFGAKRDFNDLDLSHLRIKTQELANKNNSKSAQVFYRNLVGHYRKNNKEILDIDLYARVGNSIVVRNSNDIYFSDRIQLPEILTNKFPILYYPSRSGGATAVELFGLKNLNDLDLKIVDKTYAHSTNSEFSTYLKTRIPFILAYRLDKITKEDVKRGQVLLLNKLKVECYNDLVCSIEGEKFDIEMYSYIYQNDQYYIKVPIALQLENLTENKLFIDSLSDIFLKVFDTSDEKKIFETILRQSEEDNIYDINNELADGILEDAKILLGIVSIRLSIWKAIFRIKNIEIIEELNENTIDKYILNNFPHFNNIESFHSDNTLEEMQIIRQVLAELSITLPVYNETADYKLNFDRLFQKELNDYYNNLKKELKNQLWLHLSLEDSEKQKEFLNYLFKIEHLLDNVILNNIATSYDFNEIILLKLREEIPFLNIEFKNDKQFQDYDFVEKNVIINFSENELLIIRKNLKLNSLTYFENNEKLIRSDLVNLQSADVKSDIEFRLDLSIPAELIKDFEIEIDNANFAGSSDNPWLGGNDELSSNGKKKLGINVEEIVKNYLDSQPLTYSKIEHISKTNEGEHYDLKYYDINDKKIKFVECKYFNGTSFYLSREEKRFAEANIDQYEIWLVNKDSKIFCIKNIADLGELQPLTYRVNIKLKTYAITN